MEERTLHGIFILVPWQAHYYITKQKVPDVVLVIFVLLVLIKQVSTDYQIVNKCVRVICDVINLDLM